ncbi:MAG: DNA mismatch repair protein MutL, partial [Staphylococcus xylosus]|nr:DNA mismatch repair protein MutL [Staphylococcus xylosus]
RKQQNGFQQQSFHDEVQNHEYRESHEPKSQAQLQYNTENMQDDDIQSTIRETNVNNDDYAQTQRALLDEMDNHEQESIHHQNNQHETFNQDNKAQDIANQDIKGSVSKDASRRVPYMEVVGQVHGTYIIAQNEQGMYMIDQHAAQERIKYEYFREKIGEVSNEIQNLLIPLTFHFSTDELMIINQHKEELDKVGVHLEPFGGNDYIVDSYPVWFPASEAEEIIKDMIEYVLEHKKVNVKKIREDAAIMMSCKQSIKANHYLKNNEMADLVNQLREAEDPFTCPHGRPIIINFSNYELERLFKRII